MCSPGLFITLEGVDGCGKTTQAKLLNDWLEAETGCEVILTREPGGTELGLTLRQLIQHGEQMDARTEALLFAADRAHHVSTVIRPALERGAIVLCDRYLDSSVAYQAAGRELPPNEIEQLSRWGTNELWPDVTLLFDLDPAIAQARQTAEPDRIEQEGIQFQARVRAGFLARVAESRWIVIPADDGPDQVFEKTKAALEPRLKYWEKRNGR